MGGGGGGVLRGFGGVEEEDRGLIECSVCEAFFLNTKIRHIYLIRNLWSLFQHKNYLIHLSKGFGATF